MHYAVDGTAAQSEAWPSYRFVNRVEDVWAARGDSLPEFALDWHMYYDGLGRLVKGATPDGSFAEIPDPDLDANIRGVRRVFRGAEIQNAVISYNAGMATGVRDVSSPYYGERAGRFPAGDYSLSYDAAGRLATDGTRGISRVTYSDWSDVPKCIDADGYQVFTEITPDGKFRSRQVRIPYIETVIKVNAAGDTVIHYRKRYLSRSNRICGSFEVATYNNRSHLRVNTAAGFHDITEKRRYWYLTNRQGSVMALVDSEGNVHRRSGLFPGGTPFVIDGDESTVPDMGIPSDRHHIGNRWVGFGGLNWYDNTARMHDPLLMHFNAPDQQAISFPQYGPWSHCAANPANNIDPDGMIVIADDWCQTGILEGLSDEERIYVSFDKNGVLNDELLSQCDSETNVFTALRTLSSNNLKFVMEGVGECTIKGVVRDMGYRGNGLAGQVLAPEFDKAPSPDENVHVYSSLLLSPLDRALNIAHEAYGHCYLLCLSKDNPSISPWHDTKYQCVGAEYDEELGVNSPILIPFEKNERLTKQINTVENEVRNNYKQRTK